MIHKKWYGRILTFLQIVLAAGIAAGSLFLLFRYAQYGQGEKETSGRSAEPEQENQEKRKKSEGREADEIQRISEIPDTIRVRIMDEDFQHEYHEHVTVSCSDAFTVVQMSEDFTEKMSDAGMRTIEAGKVLEVKKEELKEQEILCVKGKNDTALVLESLKRGDGAPEYHGTLYLIGGRDGITVINELPLEKYLCSVVSSEMPSDYPEEALKAQAVCARTYAVNCVDRQKNEKVWEDLNDSVSFQVYNNYRSSDRSQKAVEETTGEILPLEEVQYYSTSCLSEHREDLGNDAAFEKFLAEEPEDGVQYGSPWLRWSAKLSSDAVLENLRKEYGESSDLQEITGIAVNDRRGDGQVQVLTVTCDDETFCVEGEYKIRKILGDMQAEIELMDGSVTSKMQLLPSAFFCLEKKEEYILVKGGGYGHGNGMSQCGAAEMAEQGLDYKAILEYYYGVAAVKGSM